MRLPIGRYLRAFGAFWYDFLVGDRPELFVGSIVALAVTGLAIRAGLAPDVAALLLTVLVVGLATLSLWLASARRGTEVRHDDLG
ncbi:MAG TPA: hypothetical protein VMH24_09500 [Candidatus Sulfotelmatobacter sp.]|nr:hypothetical protein [Candidatus Sulfotelmatobacter sp.]